MARLIVRTESGEPRQFELTTEAVTIGRSPRNTVQIDDTAASRRHSRVEKGSEGWTAVDLGSSNGTQVNDARVEQHRLRHGDVIRIGTTTLEFDEGEVELELGDEASEEDCLVFDAGDRQGERVAIPPGRTSIGRGPKNGLRLEATGVSGVHCELQREAGGTVVRDLGSTNGTFVNGIQVSEQPLQHGDVLRVGTVALRFVAPGERDAGAGVPAEEVSVLTEADVGRRRLVTLVPLLLVLVVAAVGVVLYRVASRKAPYQFPDPPTGSRIALGWSIEEPGSLAQWAGDEGLEVELARGRSRSGRRSLSVGGGETPDPAFRHATFTERLEVPASGVVRVGAWIDTASLTGMAGVAVRWYASGDPPATLGLETTPFVAGPGGFRAVEDRFVAPEGAAELEISLVCFARGGKAWFDDLTVFDSDGAASGRGPLESNGFDLVRGTKGEIQVVRGERRLLRDLQLVRLRQGELWPQTVFLVPAEGAESAGRGTSGGVLHPDGSERGTVEVQPGSDESGFRVDYRLTEPRPGITFELHPILVEDGVTVVSGERWTRHYEDFADEPAASLLVGTAIQLQIHFEPPLRLTVRTVEGGLVCTASTEEGFEGDSVSVRVQTSFDTERRTAQRLLIDAQSARADVRLGEAIRLLDEIRNKYPYNPKIVADAERDLAALRADGDGVLAEVRSIREAAAFFDTEIRWNDLSERCRGLASRYEGSPYGDSIEGIAKEGEAAAGRLREERHAARGTRLLRRGRDLAASGHGAIARAVLRVLATEYEGTDLGDRANAVLEGVGDR